MIKAAYNKTTHLELSQDAISKMEIVKINIEDNTVNLRIGNNKYRVRLDCNRSGRKNTKLIKIENLTIILSEKLKTKEAKDGTKG